MHRIALALVLGLVACGGPKKQTTEDEFPVPEGPPDAGPAPTSDEEIPATLEARVVGAITMIETVAATAEKNQADCAKMGAELQAIADGPDGKVVLEMDMDPEFQQYADAVGRKFAEKLSKLGERISKAISPCDTPAVNDALTQMGMGAQ